MWEVAAHSCQGPHKALHTKLGLIGYLEEKFNNLHEEKTRALRVMLGREGIQVGDSTKAIASVRNSVQVVKFLFKVVIIGSF